MTHRIGVSCLRAPQSRVTAARAANWGFRITAVLASGTGQRIQGINRLRHTPRFEVAPRAGIDALGECIGFADKPA